MLIPASVLSPTGRQYCARTLGSGTNLIKVLRAYSIRVLEFEISYVSKSIIHWFRHVTRLANHRLQVLYPALDIPGPAAL